MPSTGYEVIYPSNCKEISEDLSLTTLRHRLKDLWSNLHRLSENLFKIDETQCERDFQFKGLALHLSGEQFTHHEDKDTRILVACCLNEIAKCYFPDSLFPDNSEANSLLENMFVLCINSLSHLTFIKTTDEVSHSRLMSLLENFLKVDFFELLQDMDCAPQVFLKYIQLLFSIIGNVQKWAWLSVQSHMDSFIENISRIINNNGSVWNEDAIRFLCRHISERHSTESGPLFTISKEIFVRTCDHVDQCVHTILTQSLAIVDESEKIYTLIFELHRINHALVAPVLPLLDIKLKSASVSDRKRACRLLGRLFSEKLTNLVNQQSQLWSAFLGRFNDIDKDVRNICVRSIPLILRNSPDLRDQLVVTLTQRSLDPDESIRAFVLEVCATLQVEHLTNRNELYADLLKIILDRVRDRNEDVRSKAATKAAKLYHTLVTTCLPADEDLWQKGKEILNCVMHLYYFPGIRDRVLVENLFKTQFVPYQLKAHERMRALLRAFCSFDEQSERCFAEMLKCQFSVTLLVEKIVLFLDESSVSQQKEVDDAKLMDLIQRLAASLDKGQNERVVDHLRRFFFHISKNSVLQKHMRQLVSAECTCSAAYDILTKVVRLHCVGGGGSGGSDEGGKDKSALAKYNHTIRTLLQRAGPVIFDAESISALVNLLVISRDDPHCVLPGEQVDVSLHNGLRLLKELATFRRTTFDSDDAFEYLADAVKSEDVHLCVLGLRVLLLVVEMLRHRREQAIGMLAHLGSLALNGTPKQAKLAVLCMMQLRLDDEDMQVRAKLDDIMEQCLQESDTLPHFVRLVVAGHVAQVMNKAYGKRVKEYVIRYLLPRIMLANAGSCPSKPTTPVKSSPLKRRVASVRAHNALSQTRKSLSLASTNERSKLELWTELNDLSPLTRLKMAAMKMMVRWLLGMQATEHDYSKPVIRVLHEILTHQGDITQCKNLAPGEMAQLRLQAAKCWIKLASCKCYVRSVSMQQFESMAFIMADPCSQVRYAFLQRLHRALIGLHLPMEYLAIYAITPEISLLSDDADFRDKVSKSLHTNVQHRRQLLASKKELSSDPRKLYALLPDLILPYVVHLLASDPNFVDESDAAACQRRKDCLWFVMEPLVVKGENYSFLRKLIYRMKACEDALNQDEPRATRKLHVICDLAYGILATKSPKFQLKEYPFEPPLPMRLFKSSDQLPSPAYADLPPGVLFSPPKNSRAVEDGVIPAERLRSKVAKSAVTTSKGKAKTMKAVRSSPSTSGGKRALAKVNVVDIDENCSTSQSESASDNDDEEEKEDVTPKKLSISRKRVAKDAVLPKTIKRIRCATNGTSVNRSETVKKVVNKKTLSSLKTAKIKMASSPKATVKASKHTALNLTPTAGRPTRAAQLAALDALKLSV